MYEELIKRLRASVDGRNEKCDGCPYEEDYPCCVDCLDKMHKQAAEAIEGLSVVVRAQKAVLDKFPKWIHVTERLPEVEDDVLIAVLTHFPTRKPIRTVTMDYINTAGKWDGASCDWRHVVTHWMPLPPPPKEE